MESAVEIEMNCLSLSLFIVGYVRFAIGHGMRIIAGHFRFEDREADTGVVGDSVSQFFFFSVR